jgi:hypothetical protein
MDGQRQRASECLQFRRSIIGRPAQDFARRRLRLSARAAKLAITIARPTRS